MSSPDVISDHDIDSGAIWSDPWIPEALPNRITVSAMSPGEADVPVPKTAFRNADDREYRP